MPSCCTTWARRSGKARGPACALSSKREKASSPRTTPSSTTLHGPGGTRKSSAASFSSTRWTGIRSPLTKRAKTRLLNEARRRTRLNRKVLIGKLAHPPELRVEKKRGPRTPAYDSPVRVALIRAWEMFDFPCGQRLAPALRQEVERLRKTKDLVCSEEVAAKLRAISPKTIDRVLAREKRVRRLRRNRNPSVHPLLYQKIPVKVASEWDTGEVGNLQVDLCVALRPLDGRGVPAHAVGGGYRHGMVGRGGHSWALAGGDPGRAGSHARAASLSDSRNPPGQRHWNDQRSAVEILSEGQDQDVAVAALPEERQRLGGTAELDACAESGGIPAHGYDRGVADSARAVCESYVAQELLPAHHEAQGEVAGGGQNPSQI